MQRVSGDCGEDMSDTSLRIPRGMKKAVVLFCIPGEGRQLCVEGPEPSDKLRNAIKAAWEAFSKVYFAADGAASGEPKVATERTL